MPRRDNGMCAKKKQSHAVRNYSDPVKTKSPARGEKKVAKRSKKSYLSFSLQIDFYSFRRHSKRPERRMKDRHKITTFVTTVQHNQFKNMSKNPNIPPSP